MKSKKVCTIKTMFNNSNTLLKGRDRLTADNWELKGTILCPVHLSKEYKYLIKCVTDARNLKNVFLRHNVFTIPSNAG